MLTSSKGAQTTTLVSACQSDLGSTNDEVQITLPWDSCRAFYSVMLSIIQSFILGVFRFSVLLLLIGSHLFSKAFSFQIELYWFPRTLLSLVDVYIELIDGVRSHPCSCSIGSKCYNSANNLLHSPMVQQAIVHQIEEKWFNDVSESSLRMLEVCGISNDVLLLVKGHLQEL
ncbi:hypothetical protein JHK84_055232 [Glycine max]|nr:hypothetical protein JHK84_055232 [Glycine max]